MPQTATDSSPTPARAAGRARGRLEECSTSTGVAAASTVHSGSSNGSGAGSEVTTPGSVATGAAAARTVADRPPHSLHGYFILPGDPSVPIVYQVDRIRDGKSFATRRCVAIQHGKAIFSLSASFQIEEEGLEHAFSMPSAPDPETLPSEDDILQR